MTTYELYINDTLCDLNTDEAITLLYQSPIFSDLDSIQSNRSYNISLPLSPTNIRAVEQSQRTDVNSEAPYVKLPARLYQNGVPLFTKGFAVVTDISDAINVTLTWGNVDNFQPLFDNNLQDLGPQLEDLGAGHIDWNEDSTILDGNTQNEYPGVAYWGVNFGMGLKDPKYIHPSVQAMTILEAIEKQHGITIDGKERLAYSPNLGPIVPLVSDNGDYISNEKEALIATLFDGTILVIRAKEDPRNILTSGLDSVPHISTSGTNKFVIQISGDENFTQGIYIYLSDTGTEDPPESLYLGALDQDGNVIFKKESTKSGYRGYVFPLIYAGIDVENIESIYINLITENNEIYYPRAVTPTNCILKAYGDWDDVVFPTTYPVAPNLPDMSQGDFVMGLMSMNGLFAYPDAKSPDTIRFISIDDIADKAKNYEVVDWSRKVVLNDMNRVDMPDTSEFTIGELAQRNTLDYENDDDVTSDTSGVIEIRNANIDKETELVTLPFSASENESTDGVTCAMVPIYEKQENGDVDYSECSARILSGRGAVIDGFVKCIGSFDSWMKFGGDQGIVAKRYASYKDIVDRVRVISVRAKLSPLDLYNLDYAKPVFIDQFGALFAIYSVETGEDGICDCQLIKINVVAKIYDVIIYYSLAGSMLQDVQFTASDYTATISCQFTNGVARISQKDIMSAFGLDGDNLYPLLDGYTLTTAIGRVLYEKQIVEGDIYMSEAPKEYYLKIQGVAADIDYSSIEAAGGSYSVRIDTDGTPYIISQDERLQASISGSGPIYSMTVVIPQNTSIYQVSYEPIVIGIRESVLLTRQITYTQQAAEQIDYYLTINGSDDDYTVSVNASANKLSVPIQTNGTVEVLTNGASFLTPSVSENNTSISIAVASNAGEARNGTLTVRLVEDPSIVRYITVKQEGASDSYYLKVRGTIYGTGITVPSKGGEYDYPVETNGTPYVVSKDDRIEASISENVPPMYRIFITVPENTSTSDIEYEDVVVGIHEDDTLRRRLSIEQKAASEETTYYLKLQGAESNVDYPYVPASGDTYNCPIETNGTPYIVLKDKRIEAKFTYEGSAITGIEFTVPENTETSKVVYVGITIGINEDDSVRRTISIEQLAAEIQYYLKLEGLEADVDYTDVPAEGAEYHPSIETNGTPRIVSKDNRLEAALRQEASDVSGIDIVVPKNDMADPVTYENIVIDLEEDNAVRRAISVSQLAAPYYLRLNGSEDRYETTVSSAAQSFTLSVETNGTPKVMPLPLEYIRIELSADGRSVTFTLDENTASEDRIIQALITLEEDSSVQRYVTITQQKADPHVEITFSNLTSLKLYFKNPDITSAYGTVDAGSDVRIVPEGDIGFYQMTTPALILKIVSTVSEVECGHWESEEPRRYVFEYDRFKREVYDKTGETEVIIKSGL
jgi:hypothetical protein